MASVADARRRCAVYVTASGMARRTVRRTKKQMHFSKLLNKLDGRGVTAVELWLS